MFAEPSGEEAESVSLIAMFLQAEIFHLHDIFFLTFTMNREPSVGKARKLFKAVYNDARRRTHPAVQMRRIPGPMFDLFLLGLCLIFGVLSLV